MRLADKVLVHQVHQAKAGVDVTASVVSNILLWRARPKAALAVRVCCHWPAQQRSSAWLTWMRWQQPGAGGMCSRTCRRRPRLSGWLVTP